MRSHFYSYLFSASFCIARKIYEFFSPDYQWISYQDTYRRDAQYMFDLVRDLYNCTINFWKLYLFSDINEEIIFINIVAMKSGDSVEKEGFFR